MTVSQNNPASGVSSIQCMTLLVSPSSAHFIERENVACYEKFDLNTKRRDGL
jgi:hypothetical protein